MTAKRSKYLYSTRKQVDAPKQIAFFGKTMVFKQPRGRSGKG